MSAKPKTFLRIESVAGVPRMLLTKGSVTYLHSYQGANICTLLVRTQEILDANPWKKIERMLEKSPRWSFFSGTSDSMPDFPMDLAFPVEVPPDFYFPSE